jgi:phage terminase small subunit
LSESKLTVKERIYVDSRLSGMTQIASAAAAGYANPESNAYEVEKHERVQKALIARMQAVAEEVDFGRKEAHDMLMQAYTNADTAMEQIAAVREMIKLHGIAEPAKVEHSHKHTAQLSLDKMDLKQLMELAGTEDFTLEGEFEVVSEQELLEHKESDEREAENG